MNIVIIGAGPAGIFAAINAKNETNNVILVESNKKIGMKLAITGKGRCNLTNSADISDFFDNVVTNHQFLYSSFYSYTNTDLIKYFNDRGLHLKEERGGRIFPVTDKAFDIIDVLKKDIKKLNIDLMLDTKVESISKKENFFVKTNKGTLVADKVVIATGGASYPMTGSDGSGYKLAEKLGHNIIKIKSALVPIELRDKEIKELVGISLKNVELRFFLKNKLIESGFGEMIFTHYGISGPIVLSLSSKLEHDRNYKIILDLKPALDESQLEKRILRDFDKYKNKEIKNALNDLLIKRLITPILERAKINEEKFVNQITKEERCNLIKAIKYFELNYKGHRPVAEGIITRGGIDVNQIDPSTMESKLVHGLYFCGEIIDVDALTGGYNLQIAFSTGYLAGKTIKEGCI